MDYTSLSKKDRLEMLKEIGVSNVEGLFESIPEAFKLKERLNIPPPLSEEEVIERLYSLSQQNSGTHTHVSFIGGGAYEHFVPTALKHLLGRSEFTTSYTPYQPELSQGTLQALFEYQTMVSEITGFEVANASMYDGSTATTEAALMALRINKRNKILVSSLLHPAYRKVIKTTLINNEIVEIPYDPQGITDHVALSREIDDDVSAMIVQYPNFLGSIEDLRVIKDILREKKVILITVTTEPFSLGILKSPGELGADIAVGEFQPFGMQLNFGGPYTGFFASRMEHVRQMPGRIVGETVDKNDKRGYVVTLATREQHIRREKATSNICTSQSLCSIGSAIYLSLIGKEGFRDIARENLSKSQYAKDRLRKSLEIPFSAPTFNEFVYKCAEADNTLRKLRERGYLGGIHLGDDYPELEGHVLCTVTEKRSKDEIDGFIEALQDELQEAQKVTRKDTQEDKQIEAQKEELT